MKLPSFNANSPEKLEKIVDNQLLVYKTNEYFIRKTIGDHFKVHLESIKASYRQNSCEKLFFDAGEINFDVLKPAEETEAKYKNWTYADIKKIQIRNLKTKINQVIFIQFIYY